MSKSARTSNQLIINFHHGVSDAARRPCLATTRGCPVQSLGYDGTTPRGLAHNWLVLLVSKRCFRTLALALPLATLVGCGERVVHRYETVGEARRDGVFERGWVPDILPDGATALVELHDLDTSARCAGARSRRSSWPRSALRQRL